MFGSRNGIGPALVALGLGLAATGALAQSVGEQEYLANCASCHGVDGAGSGPMTGYLTIRPPELTGLSAANDGEFPMLDVIQIIDGRTGVQGHGGDMPVWGSYYKAPLVGEIGDYAAETIIRGRILSLALYLQSIQQ